ncbi:FxSxx-COOH system tetratricopeptide repeat protein [Amycolatopsis sp. A133]|uniref:FxSxx-COOH system tetratricopeptide repeat protein n=1 Tax=Amycolatopsis sp. A133 TaxID=3064472 RepID=UPI0027F52976|nr:FxSxx-COOH system tetratricopeptide repeat protein [Amycolatopsis sp. A133]MDQ7809662.1 FxSxx-COOH system tetratricopeptide repeat protein [Amycolatopsis sp. A133]
MGRSPISPVPGPDGAGSRSAGAGERRRAAASRPPDVRDVADALWLIAATRTDEARARPSTPYRRPDIPPVRDTLPDTVELPPPATRAEPAPPLESPRQVIAAGVIEVPSTADSGPQSPPVSGSIRPSVIVRALRTLKRRVPAWHEHVVIVDEAATAERVAESGFWWPVTEPEMERWLDLTVVVDTARSMTLWRSTVKSFRAGLEQLGAFRTIQYRRLDTQSSGHPRSRPRLYGETSSSTPRDPSELIDPTGRRLVLLITDGVGDLWRSGGVSAVLAEWASVMPTTVLHVLPQRLWARGMDLHRARLNVHVPVAPNSQWGWELPEAWADPELAAAKDAGAIPVPVMELGPRWLRWWARLVAGEHKGFVPARVLLSGLKTAPVEGDGAIVDPDSARERVRRFLSVASPPAYRLATMLAAVPANLSVARFVQDELLPEARPEHLTEVLTSGLLRPAAAVGDETTVFDFPASVRQVLLSGARRTDTAEVVRATEARFGTITRLRDAIDAPDATRDPLSGEDSPHDISLERVVMQALSGPYASRASRIIRSKEGFDGELDVSADSAGTSTVPKAGHAIPQKKNSPYDYGEPVIHAMANASVPSETSSSTVATAGEAVDDQVRRTPELREPLPAEDAGALLGRRPIFTPEHGDSPVEDVPPVWGSVPPRNPNFTGRRELLRELGERVLSGTTAVLPSALHGMGGIGKTQMAVEYIYSHLREYDVVWWIPATHAAQIRVALTELAQALNLPGSGEANTAIPAVREALRTGRPYRRWLLVFDSAEDVAMVRQFFPTNGPGEILITSRNAEWASVARPLEVAVFERAESVELLRRRGPEIDIAEAEQLADRLGDLPLAIEQAAAWRAETGMPVQEYLRLFDEKVAEILDTSSPADYEVSVAAAWNVAFDELRTRNPVAHQLLQICAFFAPEPISRAFFSGVGSISILPEIDTALRDPMKLARAIRDINRYSLAKIDHRTNSIVLHRLVQIVLRNRMTPQHRAEMRHGAHLLLAKRDPNDPTSSKQWPRYQEILPHVYPSEIVECDDRWVRQLVINLMRYLYQWGDHDEALRLAETSHRNWTERLGSDDEQTMQAAERLGYYYWVTGRYAEAAQINRTILDTRRQLSGDNSEETLAAQIAVSGDLSASGDFVASRDLTEDVYQKAKALFGEDDPVTLRAARIHCTNLRLTGQYREAAELDEANYQRQTEILGYDHAETLSSRMGLIIDRREAGDYVWAREENEKLAERVRELFGEDNAETLRRMAYLAVSRRKAGDHEAARELAAAVLERFRVRYGEDNFNVMACALGYSIDLRHAQELRSARELGEQIFERYRRNLGEHHPHTMAAAVDLAVTLRLFGNAAAARALDERSLAQLREALGPDHPSAVLCGINLASDLSALGETAAALQLETDMLARAERALGKDHPTTLAAGLNRALDLRTSGQSQEAETLYADVLSRYRMVLRESHPGTIAASKGVRADCDIDPLPL